MDHEIARHMADTWGLLALVVVFVGAIGFLFRPGAKEHYRDCGKIPFADDGGPEK